MKKILFILFFAIPIQNLHALATIGAIGAGAAINIAQSVSVSCCIPALLWCTGSIYDALSSPENIEKHADLQSVISSAKSLDHAFNLNIKNCNINIIQTANFEKRKETRTILPVADQRFGFQDELISLARKDLKIIELAFGEKIRTLIFHDADDTLCVKELVRSPSKKEFDFLMGNGKLSTQQRKERHHLHNIVTTLNKWAKKTDDPDEGLFVSHSGRKFYKFGPAYFVPMDKDEVSDLHSVGKKCSFNTQTKALESNADEPSQIDTPTSSGGLNRRASFDSDDESDFFDS
jgi:hypothetical protein